MMNEERILKALEKGCSIFRNEDMEIIKDALKKQIPTKPILESWSPAYCPFCHTELSESLGDGYYKHYEGQSICECGQKLGWEKTD